jgi:hypothetical protein
MISLRLTHPDYGTIKEALSTIVDRGPRLIVAAYEDYSIKYRRESPLHVHALIEQNGMSVLTIRRQVIASGFKGGTGQSSYNISVRKETIDKALPYHCKGKGRGDFRVEGLTTDRILKANTEYWDIHDEVESRKDKDRSRTPIYCQIADYIRSNVRLFSIEVPGYWLEENVEYVNSEWTLDSKKVYRYIVNQYSKSGPLFDRSVVERCMYYAVSRINGDGLADHWSKDTECPNIKYDVDLIDAEGTEEIAYGSKDDGSSCLGY